MLALKRTRAVILVGNFSHFDGGGSVDRLERSQTNFNVTLALAHHSYTEGQIGELWRGKLSRVIYERIARELQK